MPNEKRKKLYDYLSSEGMTDLSYDKFSSEYSTNKEKQSKLYSYISSEGMTDLDESNFSKDYFESTEDGSMGKQQGSSEPQEQLASTTTTPSLETQYEPLEASTITEQPKEEPYFTGEIGGALKSLDEYTGFGIGDFIDDMGRSISTGQSQGALVDDALSVMASGREATPEQIQGFILAQEELSKTGQSDEMANFQKTYEEGGGDISSFLKGLWENPQVLPEIMVSSFSAMANPASLGVGGTIVGGAASVGALAGGVGAAPAAGAALPYAMGAMGATLETGLTFSELLGEELGEKEWTEDNIREILNDDDKLNKLRGKAAARGAVIGVIDAFTGKLAGRVGKKILEKGTKAAKIGSIAAATGIESVGGSTGEATARAVIGQPMDVAEIGLEGIGEAPMGAIQLASATVKPAKSKAEIASQQKHKINGEDLGRDKFLSIIELASAEDIAEMDIEINNDPELESNIADKINYATRENKIRGAAPNISDADLSSAMEIEAELESLNGNDTETAKLKTKELKDKLRDLILKPIKETTDKTDPELSEEQQTKTATLIKEKIELENSISNLDENQPSVQQKKQRIESINEEMSKISSVEEATDSELEVSTKDEEIGAELQVKEDLENERSVLSEATNEYLDDKAQSDEAARYEQTKEDRYASYKEEGMSEEEYNEAIKGEVFQDAQQEYDLNKLSELHKEELTKTDLAISNLTPWQEVLIGKKIDRQSFIDFSDKNNITNGLARTWFAPKTEKGLDGKRRKLPETRKGKIDLIASEQMPEGSNVTPQMIVDFIVANPNGLKSTTEGSRVLAGRYRELTGKSIKNHNPNVKTKKTFRGKVPTEKTTVKPPKVTKPSETKKTTPKPTETKTEVPTKKENNTDKIDATQIAEKIGKARKTKPKNIKGLFEAMKGIFSLDNKKAESVAVVGDVMIDNMAKRAGISKDEMYQKIAYAKAEKAPDGSLKQADREVNFEKWKGKNKQYRSAEIQEIKTGEPVIARVYHGTTNEFYEFDSSVKGNIGGHLGRVNYFTSDPQDAAINYQADGADITSRVEIRGEQIEQYIENELGIPTLKSRVKFLSADEKADIAKNFNLDVDKYAEKSISDLPKIIAEKELKGQKEQTLDLYVKLNNPVVLGKGRAWIDVIPEDSYKDSLEYAAQEVADENGLTIDEAKEDFQWEVRERAMEIEGVENPFIDALQNAINDNTYSGDVNGKAATEILQDFIYDEEVDLNQLEKTLREELTFAENEDGELSSSQIISDFFKNLGYDGIILTNVSQRFQGMGLGSSTSHIHVFDEYANQIKLADGSNTDFSDSKDIRFQLNRGAMRMGLDMQATIYALTSPNVSTPLHELAHVYEHYLTDAERKQIERWSGHKSGTTEFSEAFARGFEKFLADGKVNNPRLQKIFENFKTWLTEIYNGIKGSDIDVELNDEMKSIYNAMLLDNADKTDATEVEGKKERRAAKRVRDYASEKGVEIDRSDKDFYTPEKQSEVEENIGNLKETDLHNLAKDKDAKESLRVASSIELIKRAVARGEDPKEIREMLSEKGTDWGQAIAMYARLKTSTPEGVVSVIVDKLESKGRYLKDIAIDKKDGKLKNKKKTKEIYKEVADNIRKVKFTKTMKDLSSLRSDPTALFTGAWDGAVETFASSVELTGNIFQAVEDAVDYVKATEWYNGLSKDGKQKAESILRKDLENEALGQTQTGKELKKIKEKLSNNETQLTKLRTLAEELIKTQQGYAELGRKVASGDDVSLAEIKSQRRSAEDAAHNLDKFINDVLPSSWGDLLSMAVQGSLLTMKSIVKNPVYNIFRLPPQILAEGIGETILIAGDMGRAASNFVLGNEVANNRKRLFSLSAYLYAMKHGAPEGFKEAVSKFATGKQATGTNFEYQQNRGFMPLRAWAALVSNTKLGDAMGVKRDMMAVNENGKVELGDKLKNLFKGTFGVPAELMFRMLPFGDTPFYRLIETKELYLLAKQKGLKGKAFEDFMKFPPKDAIEESAKEAAKSVFQEESYAAKKAQKATAALRGNIDNPLINNFVEFFARTQFPFVKTPVNVINQTADFAIPPLSLMKAIYHASHKKDYRKAAEYIGKSIVGGIMIEGAAALIANGLVTGALYGSDDWEEKRERNFAYSTQPPNTINISGLKRLQDGGDPTWRMGDEVKDYRTWGFFGSIIGMHVNSTESKERIMARHERREVIGKEINEFSSLLTDYGNVPAMASYALDQSFLAGTSNLLKAATGDQQAIDNWVRQTFKAAASVVLPNQLSHMNKIRSEYMPDLRGKDNMESMLNVILDKTFQTDELPVRYDLAGNPIKNTPEGENPYVYHLLDPFSGRKTFSNKEFKEMYDVFNETRDMRGIIQMPQRSFSYNGENFYMDTETYNNFVRDKQKYAIKELGELFDKSSYENKSANIKTEKIQNELSKINRSSFVKKLKKKTALELKRKASNEK